MIETPVLVDANVLLDILTADPAWLTWSSTALGRARAVASVVVNPIICAELAPAFQFDWQKLNQWLQPSSIIQEAIPFPASVIAAKAHVAYRVSGGTRSTPLPDFFIGAHAEHAGYSLLTRDAARYRTYFPRVPLIAP
jgi:predicted nucleic acid-binding protein